MSIFASTSGPSLINIPTFTSPVHPQTQDSGNESTKLGGSPSKALTRAEERQKRFRIVNTQWDSLTRVIEQQKANSSQSLLHLIGGSSTTSKLTGEKGKGKEVEGKVERRKSTRGRPETEGGTLGDDKASRKSPSPQKSKRELSGRDGKGESTRTGERKRAREDEKLQQVTEGVETRPENKGESSSRNGRPKSNSMNSLAPPVHPIPSSPPPVASTSNSGNTTAPSKPRGRAPRAAMRRAPNTVDSVPSTSTYLRPHSHSPAPLPTTVSSVPVPTSPTAPIDSTITVEPPKKRRKPRAAPPTPAASRLRAPPAETVEVETSLEVVPDSQVEADTGSKGGKEREETELGSKKGAAAGKKRKVVTKSTADVDDETVEESLPKKKIKVVEETRANSKVAVERRGNQGKATEASKKKGATSKVQKKELTKIEASIEKKGKKGKEGVTLSSSPPSSPQPPKKATKRSKPVVPPPPHSSSPILSPVHSPVLSFEHSSVPPLLSSPVSSKSKSTNSKAKQHLVRSERLETDFSQEGKVNVYDVIIGGAKSALKDVLEDLDEEDETDQIKIEALKRYVATFRLSLLHRSADLSEYSAMQRKLATAKARSKKLKAELGESKREKKGK